MSPYFNKLLNDIEANIVVSSEIQHKLEVFNNYGSEHIQDDKVNHHYESCIDKAVSKAIQGQKDTIVSCQ